MRMMSGSILILAAAVVLHAIWTKTGQGGEEAAWPMVAIALVGVALLIWGAIRDRP